MSSTELDFQFKFEVESKLEFELDFKLELAILFGLNLKSLAINVKFYMLTQIKKAWHLILARIMAVLIIHALQYGVKLTVEL